MFALITFILVLSLLVVIHELGHLLAAKAFGVRADEFGVGFPPRLASFKWGETRYSLNLLLFGGFVKIFGENPDDSAPGDTRNFQNKNRGIQAVILVAGVFFNFLLAWVLFSSSLVLGMPISTSANIPLGQIEEEKLMIVDVMADSPATLAGLKAGDEIVSLSAFGQELVNPSVEEAIDFISASGGREFSAEILRGAEQISVSILPKEGIVSDGFAIGVSLDKVGIWQAGILEAIPAGLVMTINMTERIVVGFVDLIAGAFAGQNVVKDLVGPVGLVGLVDGAREIGWSYLLSFTAFISLNLTVLNLLPLPILDGGRLLITGIEAIKRSAVKPEIVGYLNLAGLFLLGFLMIAVTFQDIARLF